MTFDQIRQILTNAHPDKPKAVASFVSDCGDTFGEDELDEMYPDEKVVLDDFDLYLENADINGVDPE